MAAEDIDTARYREQRPRPCLHESGLAAAVGTEQTVDVAFGDRAAQTAQDRALSAVSRIQILHFNHKLLLYCLPVGRHGRRAQFPLSRSVG